MDAQGPVDALVSGFCASRWCGSKGRLAEALQRGRDACPIVS